MYLTIALVVISALTLPLVGQALVIQILVIWGWV